MKNGRILPLKGTLKNRKRLLLRCVWCRELYESRRDMLTGDLLRLALRYHEVKIEDAKRVVPHINDILNHRRPLTRDVAFTLEAAFFIKTGIWKHMTIQRYDWWKMNRMNYISYEEQLQDRITFMKNHMLPYNKRKKMEFSIFEDTSLPSVQDLLTNQEP